MEIKNRIKYSVFKKPLTLAKTHDFCASKNTKLTVVLIHGIASNSGTFKNTLSYLEGTTSLKDVRFVTFDLLGAGKSYESDKLSYTLNEQLEALHNSIAKLKIDTPLVLLGHSLGSLIVMNYANTYKKSVKKLIMVSPPIYTEKDLNHPLFKENTKMFKDLVSAKDKKAGDKKQFNVSMEQIVLTDKNYKLLSKLTTDTTILYGDLDIFIASYNLPAIVKANSRHIAAIKTVGKHPMSRDKYHKLVPILEEILNETI